MNRILAKHVILSAVFIVTFSFCFGLNPAMVLGKESIKARYSAPRGEHIKWKIKIPSPSPEAVIVTQYILPGTTIKESSHPVSSYDREKGIAKWILTGIKPGLLKMEITIDKPIRKKGEIRGEIMFKDQASNTIASVLMKSRVKKKAVEGC